MSDITPSSENNVSDVTSWRFSRFQGKMTIPDYHFGDYLQFMHRKMQEWRFLKNTDTCNCWLCDFL